MLSPGGVGVRLAVLLYVPCIFFLSRVLVVFLAVSIYMVSEPDSSLSLGRVALGYSYPVWWMGFCLAMGDLRNVLSWVSVCHVLPVQGCGGYR